MPSHEDLDQATTARSPRGERRWFLAAAAALAIAAFAATFTQVFNYDIFWHLAAGEWMLAHGAVLGTDPFSVQPLAEWVNVHWLFQVIVAWLHGAGGFGLLSGLKATLAAATLLVLALALRRQAPVAWLVVCGLGTIVIVETRFRVRPEAFTLLFLMITIAVVEHVRRGGASRWLWGLAPLMVVWVNMHGLYVLGPAVFWSAAIGAALDRRLGRGGIVGSVPVRASGEEPRCTSGSLRTEGERLAASLQAQGLASWRAVVPLAVASVACLLSPWPLEAAAQPLLLWTRISGQTAAFTQGVSEFQPTWQSAFYGTLAAAIVTPAAIACLLRWRAVPLAHAVWLAAFAGLAMLACRNVALTGPVCGYLLALHGGQLWRRIPSSFGGRRLRRGTGILPVESPGSRAGTALRPMGETPMPPQTGVVTLRIASLVLAVAFAATCATEWFFRVRGVHRRFGPGLYSLHYATEVAQRLAAVPGGGDIFCENWGDAGPFIYYCQPRRVWMDGRLEAHTLERFLRQGRISEALRTPQSAATVELPRELRFFFVRSLSRDHLTALSLSGRFRLRFVDPTGACFERLDWPLLRGDATQGKAPDLANYDRPLGPDLRVEGVSVEPRRWWRQNPLSPNYRLGAMFLWLGWQPTKDLDRGDSARAHLNLLAVRYLEAALADGLTDRPTATGMLAYAHQRRAMHEDVTPTDQVPFDFHSSRALYLYNQLDLTNPLGGPKGLADENTRRFAEQHVDALVRARMIDLADQASADLLRHLPAGAEPTLRRQYAEMAKRIADRLAESRRAAAAIGGTPAERAKALAGPDIGLMGQALGEAEQAKPPNSSAMLAGDLLLRCGRADQAKLRYGMEVTLEPPPWRPPRVAIAEAVAGRYQSANEVLGQLRAARDGHQALQCYTYFNALILEVLGNYAQAREVLKGVESTDEQLSRLLEAMRDRLPN